MIEDRFADDTVRGVVATDALIGTFADLHDRSLVQNRCFLYHLIGNGTGEWRVPVGGMGAVTDALAAPPARPASRIVTGAGVTGSSPTAPRPRHLARRRRLTTVAGAWVLGNVAPWVLQVLLGEDAGERPRAPSSSQPARSTGCPGCGRASTPRRRSPAPSTSPRTTASCSRPTPRRPRATSRGAARRAVLPLADRPLDPGAAGGPGHAHADLLRRAHARARLFAGDVAGQRDQAVERALDAINELLEEPIESLLALDANGAPCLEAKAPQDVDEALAMPGGHIFHGDLAWPWAPNRALLDTPAQRWGVATDLPNVLLCGSGARRGGAVSGIGGHNAAQAVLEVAPGTADPLKRWPGRP